MNRTKRAIRAKKKSQAKVYREAYGTPILTDKVGYRPERTLKKLGIKKLLGISGLKSKRSKRGRSKK